IVAAVDDVVDEPLGNGSQGSWHHGGLTNRPTECQANRSAPFSAQANRSPGRPGWSPTQAPHRSVLAQLTHTAPHFRHSLLALSVVVVWTRPRVPMHPPCFAPTVV